MKGTVKVEIEIPVEYKGKGKERLLQDLKEYFNIKNNKSSVASFSSEGDYFWKLPRKNAKVSLIEI